MQIIGTYLKSIQVTEPGCPMHLVSKNKRVRMWYRRFGYATNARIIRVLKLLTGIDSFDNTYDCIKIYNDSEQSVLDKAKNYQSDDK